MQVTDADIKIIKRIAGWYATKTNIETDELVNVAVLDILSKDVKRIENRDNYIWSMTNNSIKDFLMENCPLIKIPTRSAKRHDQSMKQVPIDPNTFAITPEMGPVETVAIHDSLRHAAETPMEKAYIDLRIEGLTNQEAMVDLDISSFKASTMLRAIEKRFRKDWYE